MPSTMRPACTGNADRHGRQRRLDVGRHVVRPLVAVDEIGHGRVICRRHQAAEEGVEIAAHIRIGILLDQKRAGRMPHEDGQKPLAARPAASDTKWLASRVNS